MRCPTCDADNPVGTERCSECGKPLSRRPRRRSSDEEPGDPLAMVLPYQNPKALTAYYCGVFGLIPCVGLVLGPIALVMGILGWRYAKGNPSAKGKSHALTGIVLGSLELLVNGVGLLFVLVGLAFLASPSGLKVK